MWWGREIGVEPAKPAPESTAASWLKHWKMRLQSARLLTSFSARWNNCVTKEKLHTQSTSTVEKQVHIAVSHMKHAGQETSGFLSMNSDHIGSEDDRYIVPPWKPKCQSSACLSYWLQMLLTGILISSTDRVKNWWSDFFFAKLFVSYPVC